MGGRAFRNYSPGRGWEVGGALESPRWTLGRGGKSANISIHVPLQGLWDLGAGAIDKEQSQGCVHLIFLSEQCLWRSLLQRVFRGQQFPGWLLLLAKTSHSPRNLLL